ncbi:MAG: hypothetical protein H7174_00995, partial [Flavobacterium sp.]|nr:hypothetical protein [Flavobacterium sp.]
MINYQISNFATINGIGSASGIVFLDHKLYIIGDNSGFLYEYNINSQKLEHYPLIENAITNIAKKDKPDFESITLRNNKLHLFGSGSTKKREIRVKFDLKTQEVKTKDLTNLYDKLKLKANFTNDDLNIEGSFFYNNRLYFLNRGNGLLNN